MSYISLVFVSLKFLMQVKILSSSNPKLKKMVSLEQRRLLVYKCNIYLSIYKVK